MGPELSPLVSDPRGLCIYFCCAVWGERAALAAVASRSSDVALYRTAAPNFPLSRKPTLNLRFAPPENPTLLTHVLKTFGPSRKHLDEIKPRASTSPLRVPCDRTPNFPKARGCFPEGSLVSFPIRDGEDEVRREKGGWEGGGSPGRSRGWVPVGQPPRWPRRGSAAPRTGAAGAAGGGGGGARNGTVRYGTGGGLALGYCKFKRCSGSFTGGEKKKKSKNRIPRLNSARKPRAKLRCRCSAITVRVCKVCWGKWDLHLQGLCPDTGILLPA